MLWNNASILIKAIFNIVYMKEARITFGSI